jgi:PAS domain S-box-containing protein
MARVTQTLILQALKNQAGRDSLIALRRRPRFDSGADVTFAGLAGIFDRRHASQAAGLAAVAVAAAALIGRWADLPLLSGWGTGLPVMTPFAAVCLAALGLALMRPRDPGLAFVAGLAITAVAAVDLALAIAGGGRGIDPDIAATGLSLMSAAMAVGLMLAGGALVLSGFERHDLVATALAAIAGAIAAFVLFGYMTGINRLYVLTSIGSPTLPTAAALLCIAVGVILRSGARPALQRPRPLWHLLAVLGSAIVAPLFLFGAYAGARMADAQFEQVRGEMMDEVRTLSADVDREIIGEFETLEALAASPSLRQGDFAALQRQAEAPLTLRQSGNIVLFDRSMRQIVNTSAPFGTPMPEAVIREPVERALATGKTQITGLFEGPVARDTLYAIIMPVEIDGEFRYALARSPSQHALARVVAANLLPPGRSAVVADAAHRIIAQSGEDIATAVGEQLPQSRWPRGRASGILEFTDSKGRPSLQAYTHSELSGWEEAISAPKAVLGAPLRALWRTLGWMALLAFMLVVALALWVGRIIARSVGQAARAAVAVGEGRPLPPSGTPVAEVNTLMEELRETAAKRQAAEDFLRDSEWRLQLALAAAQLGSWQHDPVRRVLSGDARAKELFDFAGDEVAAEELLARVHPEDVERVSATLRESLDPATPNRSSVEFRLRRRNGEYRWLETLGLAHFEDSGDARSAVSIVGTVQDITERKELEAERRARAEKEHLLMREMNHRAKNMLSVVDAIAHQTATRSPEDFVARFSERIQSLSANQDLLMRTEWKGVEIKSLVHAQLAHFADLIGTRISADGPRLRLKASSAQAVGLALHELATNAGKYGALSADTGRVDIRWDAGVVFTMSWTESGGPPVTPPERRGFGSILMGVMAERSVGGAVELDYAPAGVTWRLTCPAANALESWEWGDREKDKTAGGQTANNRTAAAGPAAAANAPAGAASGDAASGDKHVSGDKDALPSGLPRPAAGEGKQGAPSPPAFDTDRFDTDQFNTELRGR